MIVFHLRWLWLMPAGPSVAFLLWVLWNLHRESKRMKHDKRR
jgi:hypothetical protein